MKPLNLSQPRIIVMVGIPGSGKSFFAEHFADTFSIPYVHFNRIERELDIASNNTTVENLGNYFLEELYKTNRTIIIEGKTDARADRIALTKKAREAGYEPLFVWVQTESVAAKQRATRSTSTRKAITSDQFDAMIKRFTPPNVNEKAVVVSGKHTYPSQLKIVLKRLVEPRIESVENQLPIVRPSASRHIAVR